MITTFFVLGQILTLISYLIFWISRFFKEKKEILIGDNISRVVAIVAFLFLGTYDGIKNTVYVIIRNILGDIVNEKNKKYKIITFIVMLIILFIMYSFNFNGISTICVAICGVFNLYGVIMCNEQGIRIFGMIGSAFYAAFMFFTFNITGTICELICFIVMLISYLKYKNNEENKDNSKMIER